jgi:5'-nucleotidase
LRSPSSVIEKEASMAFESPRFDGESVTFAQTSTPDGKPSSSPAVRLLHYNDVYHLDASSAEPQGGVARFVTAWQQYRDDERFQGQPELVTLFSGDVFNPSLESSITKGLEPPSHRRRLIPKCRC